MRASTLRLLCGGIGWVLVAVPVVAGAGFGHGPGDRGEERSVGPLVLAEVQAAPLRLPPRRPAQETGTAPLAELEPAALAVPERLEELLAWNRAGLRPLRNGFARPLPRPRPVELDVRAVAASLAAAGDEPLPFAGGVAAGAGETGWVWAARVAAAGAYRLRLHLADVHLPPGTRLWVSGEEETVGPFGVELLGSDGGLWTPSVAGPAVTLEMSVPVLAEGPGEPARFILDEVLELLPPGALTAPPEAWSAVPAAPSPPLTPRPGAGHDTSCLVDATCVGTETLGMIGQYRRAVAHLEFIDGGAGFVCTGGLLNDTDDSTVIPYLLTANHCFSRQNAASTLEAFWDYRTAACGGAFPNLGSLPRSNGATLLASSVQTDFTLVRLNAVPAGRVLLGWSTAAVPGGTLLHRLSHPYPDLFVDPAPQSYSQTRIAASPFSCGGADEDGRPLDNPNQFLKTSPVLGGTFGGSSGAPLVLATGQVVGQLYGACGPDVDEGCGRRQSEVDGAFRATFSRLSQFLDTGTGGGTSPCVAGPTTLCLEGGRFAVRVDWRTAQGTSGVGRAVALTSNTGYFWFFDSTNVELVVKVLDACSFANRFWVFAGGLTNVEVEIAVTDTERGGRKVYRNPLNAPFQPVQDTDAFATCP